MARLEDNLVRADAWSDLVMGNHAVARAMIEAGVQVVTTYPGSPTPEIAQALTAVPRERRPYHFEYSTNEKVAVEVAAGASLNGRLAAVFFKSVGLNVASDSVVQLPLLEMPGGLVIVLGDDPGLNSSQNEQDNRHFSRMSYIPMLEPATPGEAYAMFLKAAELAARHRSPIFLRMTTHVCHAKEVVHFAPIRARTQDLEPRFDPTEGPYIPITRAVVPMKRRALAKLEAFAERSEGTRWNAVLAPNGAKPTGGKRRGMISAGIPALAVLENLAESGRPLDLLRLGMTFPLPRRKIAEFLETHDEVLVIEELDPVMETEIKAIAWDVKVRAAILSRTSPEQRIGELTPDRTWALLAEHWPDLFPPRPARPAFEVVPRSPQLCPGCGHRSAFHAIKAALAEDSITVADIGCHTLGFMPPYAIGQALLCMGHSTGTGAGLAIRNEKRKVVAFLGDSTLFHAGLPGIVNAVVNGHDLTLVVMDNGTTAMTGHQPRAGAGEVGDKIPLAPLLSALGVKLVREVDTYSQAKLTAAVKEAMAFEGLAVVIARHPCMLKLTRDQRRKDPALKLSKIRLDAAKCDRRLVCVAAFGCPSFVRREDGGVGVHGDLCIGDGSCVQTCPTQALGRGQAGGGR